MGLWSPIVSTDQPLAARTPLAGGWSPAEAPFTPICCTTKSGCAVDRRCVGDHRHLPGEPEFRVELRDRRG